MKTALFTGSFDPMTKGHLDLIKRSSQIFGNVIVAVGDNPAKKYLFSKDERVSFIEKNVADCENVSVISLPNGKLAADLAYEHDAVIIKGVRINADFDYEKMMHEINHLHNQGVDTMIFPSQSQLNHISSSATKEICKLNGNTEDFVTFDVKSALEKRLVNQVRVTVTGTIGAGKSSVVKEIEKINDTFSAVHNIDLDVIAHDILFSRKEPVYVKLREQLASSLNVSTWDRKNVGDRVFNFPKLREILNSALRQPMLTRIRGELQGKEGLIIFNGALIAEADWLYLSNNNVALLDVNVFEQRKRLFKRGYTEDQIGRRLSAQLSTKQKVDLINKSIHKHNYGQVKIFDTSFETIKSTAEKIIQYIHS